MQAVRGNADDDFPDLDGRTVDDRVGVDHADAVGQGFNNRANAGLLRIQIRQGLVALFLQLDQALVARDGFDLAVEPRT